MNDCLACLLKPTYRCDSCDEAEVCEGHSDQFTIYCSKDGDEGMMMACFQCRPKVASRYNTMMHWSMSLKEYMAS